MALVLLVRRSAGLLAPSVGRAHRGLRTAGAAGAGGERIESTTNALVKQFKRCHRKRERDATGLVLVEGARLVAAALETCDAEAVLVADGVAFPAAAAAAAAGARVAFAPAAVVAAASATVTPAGVAALVRRPALESPSKPGLVLALDGVSDPGNVGALIRTAAAAGADAVLAVGSECADVFGPKAVRASAGAAFAVPVVVAPDWASAAATLGRWGVGVLVADVGAGAVDAWDLGPWRPTCVVAGAETGLSAGLEAALGGLGATRTKIDIDPSVESLNAAVAGSYLLLDARRRRRASVEG